MFPFDRWNCYLFDVALPMRRFLSSILILQFLLSAVPGCSAAHIAEIPGSSDESQDDSQWWFLLGVVPGESESNEEDSDEAPQELLARAVFQQPLISSSPPNRLPTAEPHFLAETGCKNHPSRGPPLL